MPAINRGFQRENNYVKKVTFDKAVIWMHKELSIPPDIVDKIKERELENIIFEDEKRNQRLTISVEAFLENAALVKRFQEVQHYIKLHHFTSSKIDEAKEDKPIKI